MWRQPGAAKLPGGAGRSLAKALKNVLQLIGRNANAGVAHPELDREGTRRLGKLADAQRHAAGVRKLEGVGK